jgi:hypothetical protein
VHNNRKVKLEIEDDGRTIEERRKEFYDICKAGNWKNGVGKIRSKAKSMEACREIVRNYVEPVATEKYDGPFKKFFNRF